MPRTRNLAVIFNNVPQGMPMPFRDLQMRDRPIDLENTFPPQNGLLIKNIYFSIDPYMRRRMRDPGVNGHNPPYALNEPITNTGVSRVLRSRHRNYKPGDEIHILQVCPMEEYTLVTEEMLTDHKPLPTVEKIVNPYGLDLTNFLHGLGMPGLTAYSSFYGIAGPKFTEGEVMWITSAAGAVGQIVGQLAKREGMRVIGSVGADHKLEYILQELGFDEGWNYKKEAAAEALHKRTPDGIEVYYENVGGELLEVALAHMRPHGRIVVSGMISQYNKPIEQQYGIKTLSFISRSRIKMEGFLVSDENMGPTYRDEWQRNMSKWLAEGLIKTRVCMNEGIENTCQALVDVLQGANFGKAILRV